MSDVTSIERRSKTIRRSILVAVSLALLAGAAYLVVDDSVQDAVYASWYYPDGSTSWKPLDTGGLIRDIASKGMNNVMLQLDRDPHSSPSDHELEGAWALYRDSFESAQNNGWFEYENAVEDGFRIAPRDRYHYPNERNLTDGEDLVPGKPEFLMYYPSPEREGERVLVGFMYMTSGFKTHGQQVGGSLSRWHKHMYSVPDCFGHDMVPSGASIRELALLEEQGWECDGVKSSESPEMLHVWFVDHPVSQFDVDMSLRNAVIETPRMMSKEEFVLKHRPGHHR